MTAALDLLAMDRFEISLQLVGSVPHFPALDLLKGLADPSCATSSTPSLFGPGHALAGRQELEPCQPHLKLRFFGATRPIKNLRDDARPIVTLDPRPFPTFSPFLGC